MRPRRTDDGATSWTLNAAGLGCESTAPEANSAHAGGRPDALRAQASGRPEALPAKLICREFCQVDTPNWPRFRCRARISCSTVAAVRGRRSASRGQGWGRKAPPRRGLGLTAAEDDVIVLRLWGEQGLGRTVGGSRSRSACRFATRGQG